MTQRRKIILLFIWSILTDYLWIIQKSNKKWKSIYLSIYLSINQIKSSYQYFFSDNIKI